MNQEYIATINIYTLNLWSAKYINRKLTSPDLKEEINSNKMIVGDLDFIFNNLEESINKETADLNNTIN